VIIDRYIDIPKQKGVEFWDIQRISYIRRLSSTGKGNLTLERTSSLRVLDRVNFKLIKREEGPILPGKY
jgi:hypothetical protein